MSNRQYLGADWKSNVLPALKYLCKNRCQLCGRTDRPLEGHHNNYEAVGRERPEDVIILCTHHHALYEWWEKHGNDLGLFEYLESERQRARSASVRFAHVDAWNEQIRDELRHANDMLEASWARIEALQELKDIQDSRDYDEREKRAAERGEMWLSSRSRKSRKQAMSEGSLVGWHACAAIDEWNLLILTAIASQFSEASNLEGELDIRWRRWEGLYNQVLRSDDGHLWSLRLFH